MTDTMTARNLILGEVEATLAGWASTRELRAYEREDASRDALALLALHGQLHRLEPDAEVLCARVLVSAAVQADLDALAASCDLALELGEWHLDAERLAGALADDEVTGEGPERWEPEVQRAIAASARRLVVRQDNAALAVWALVALGRAPSRDVLGGVEAAGRTVRDDPERFGDAATLAEAWVEEADPALGSRDPALARTLDALQPLARLALRPDDPLPWLPRGDR
ncbi:MAG: hypothetical protein Q8Q14_03875 [Gemmatimonadales bacterium]|nr:hypothetical protein [Gemmatimonadales bacterium]